jgi:hypothetical protein
MRRAVHAASCPCGELSTWRAVRVASCPRGELSMGRAVHVASCTWGELYMGQAVMGRVVRGIDEIAQLPAIILHIIQRPLLVGDRPKKMGNRLVSTFITVQ